MYLNASLLPSQGKGEKEAENLIYTVLRQRHMKEAIHLEDQLRQERQAAIKRAQADVREKRQTDRERLLAAFEQELLDLVAEAGSMSSSELAQQKEELKRQQQVNWILSFVMKEGRRCFI